MYELASFQLMQQRQPVVVGLVGSMKYNYTYMPLDTSFHFFTTKISPRNILLKLDASEWQHSRESIQ